MWSRKNWRKLHIRQLYDQFKLHTSILSLSPSLSLTHYHYSLKSCTCVNIKCTVCMVHFQCIQHWNIFINIICQVLYGCLLIHMVKWSLLNLFQEIQIVMFQIMWSRQVCYFGVRKMSRNEATVGSESSLIYINNPPNK